MLDIPGQPGSIITQLSRHIVEDDIILFRERYNAFNEDGTPNWESGFFKTLPEGVST
jgi:hypothetical protein